MNTNNALAWLQENLQRLFTRSPKFFQVWNIVNGAIALLAGVPTILVSAGVVLPPARWAELIMKIAAAAGAWGYFMGKLSVQRPTITKEGEVLEPAKDAPLAFTDKVEAKKVEAQKDDPSVPTKVVIEVKPTE